MNTFEYSSFKFQQIKALLESYISFKSYFEKTKSTNFKSHVTIHKYIIGVNFSSVMTFSWFTLKRINSKYIIKDKSTEKTLLSK